MWLNCLLTGIYGPELQVELEKQGLFEMVYCNNISFCWILCLVSSPTPTPTPPFQTNWAKLELQKQGFHNSESLIQIDFCFLFIAIREQMNP